MRVPYMELLPLLSILSNNLCICPGVDIPCYSGSICPGVDMPCYSGSHRVRMSNSQKIAVCDVPSAVVLMCTAHGVPK